MSRLEPGDEEQRFLAFEGRVALEPGWKILVSFFWTGSNCAWLEVFFFDWSSYIFTWLEEPDVVENVGRGIVEQVEEGPRPNLKNTMKKKEIGVPVI